MREDARPYRFVQALPFVALVGAFALELLIPCSAALAQIAGGTDVNASQNPGADSECAIVKNPSNELQLFLACNTSGPGLFAARSTDGGQTWIYPDADKTLADGDPGQGAQACCDPTLAWDTFGNLYLSYLDSAVANVVTLISTDSGATFNNLASFAGSVDQPTIVAANTSAPGAPVAVWVVWNQSNQMRARGAAVTGLGAVGAFGALQTIPGTVGCSFGDIAIAPTGVVVQACQNPTGGQGPATIFVNTDADGLGAGNFGAAVTATTTNVGGFDFIPAQNARSVDSEAGLVYDANPASPNFGRLYLVYTEEVVDEAHDTDVMVRFSDNDGATWSAPIRVNDDPAVPIRSQFLPKIASDTPAGDISVCWYDARNSAPNTAAQVFCSIARPTGAAPTFLANGQISDGASTSTGLGIEFGDYAGLAYFEGLAHPAWADTSNSTGDNPDTTTDFDVYTDRVAVQADIRIAKSDDPDPVPAGGELRYTLTVTNEGPGSSSDVEIQDTLPAGVVYQSDTGACGHMSGVVTCTFMELTPGQTEQIDIIVTVDPLLVDATGSTTISNNVTVSSRSTPDPDLANNTATEETSVLPGCGGMLATIVGTPGNDNVLDTSADDVIATLAGDDSVVALRGGDDAICGGGGDDTVLGLAGNNEIDTGPGDDNIGAGPGDDVIAAGDGDDIIVARSGDDMIDAGLGDDHINAGSGSDAIDAGPGNDNIGAGSGDDTIDAGAGNDSIVAGAGDDGIEAGAGDDTVGGNPGDDTIDAGVGDDKIDAGPGNDLIDGGPGTDTCVNGEVVAECE